MSVASVTNKTLQLAELVISNEKFFGATGYVASSSSFSSSVNSTSLTVPEIISPTVTVGTSSVNGSFTCTVNEELNTTAALNVGGLLSTATLQINGGGGSSQLTSDGTTLVCNEIFSATALNINNSTGINAFILQNLTSGFTSVPAGAGVETSAVGCTTTNVRFSLSAGASYATLFAFAGGVTTNNGVSLILSQIYVSAPSNGLTGYCNVETVWINVTGTDSTPTNVKIVLISYGL
jgi:hypothetical protein